jgi:hypothetical protein
MLWLLRDLGHNLLILDGMIDNRLGAQAVRDKYPEIRKYIADSSFMMQFSCEGKDVFDFHKMPNSQDFCFYIAEETDFGIDKDAGGDTEAINVVCEMENICGVNMPAGYYDTHTPDEYLVIADWLSVLDITERMLSKPLRRYCAEPDRRRSYSRPHGLSGRNIVIPPKP